MPPKENNAGAKREVSVSFWISGAVAAILSFAVISILLQPLETGPETVILMAACGALVVGTFVARERYLGARLRLLEDVKGEGKALEEAVRSRFFLQSVAAFARYDPVSFRVVSASPGLLTLAGYKAEESIVDKSMVDVLLTDSSTFRRVTDAMRREGSDSSFVLDCRRKNGRAMEVKVSGALSPDRSVIEAAFVEVTKFENNALELERTEGDLERFRLGMIRREFRILELKGEVNRLCDQLGTRRCYKIDGETHDLLVEQLLKEKEKAMRA